MTPLRVHVRRKNQGMAGIKSVQRKRARAKALPPAPDGYANAVSAVQRYAKENRNKKKVAGPWPFEGNVWWFQIPHSGLSNFFAFFHAVLRVLCVNALVAGHRPAGFFAAHSIRLLPFAVFSVVSGLALPRTGT